MNSKAFSINMVDVISIAKNASLVGVAAGLTYIGQNITSIDFGAASALIVPVTALLIDTAVKWAKDNTK
jgi:hypothetical protein